MIKSSHSTEKSTPAGDVIADYRLLTSTDVQAAANVLSQAFVDDPLSRFMLPLRLIRVRTLRTFFRAYGEVNIKNQRGYGVGEPLKGVAFWNSPHQADLSISIKSLTVFIPLLFSFYPIGYLRARAIIRQIDAMHREYAPEAHYYLDNIGVLPDARRQGISSRLIRPILSKADEEKVIVYTDTVTRSNVPFYEHFGFQCVEALPVPASGITVYAMRRPLM